MGSARLVAAEVDLGERGAVTVVSLYGLNEFAKRVGDETSPHRHAITSVHWLLSDLTPLIDLRGRVRSPRALVLAGDLNVSTQLDPPDRERHRNVLERFTSLGLTDAWTVSPDKMLTEDCVCVAPQRCARRALSLSVVFARGEPLIPADSPPREAADTYREGGQLTYRAACEVVCGASGVFVRLM